MDSHNGSVLGTHYMRVNSGLASNLESNLLYSANGATVHHDCELTLKSHLFRTSPSTVPFSGSEHGKLQYAEVIFALDQMKELAEDDEWKISSGVFNAACFAAQALIQYPYPAPKVFSHGPTSVVFNWSEAQENVYLTISEEKVSLLRSSPERIKMRGEMKLSELANPTTVFSTLAESCNLPVLTHQIAGTVPESLELGY